MAWGLLKNGKPSVEGAIATLPDSKPSCHAARSRNMTGRGCDAGMVQRLVLNHAKPTSIQLN